MIVAGNSNFVFGIPIVYGNHLNMFTKLDTLLKGVWVNIFLNALNYFKESNKWFIYFII